MKKWVLFLLIAGIVTSNLNTPKDQMESSSIKNSQTEELPREIQGVKELPVDKELLTKNNKISKERNFLFVTTKQDKAEKAVIVKQIAGTQRVEIANLSKKEIMQLLGVHAENLKAFSKDESILDNMESKIGISIDHIIVIDKKGYDDMITKVFPDGIPIQLTDEMRKDLELEDNNQKNYVDAHEFLETIKTLKATHKYDHELNQMIVNTFSSELSKPDVVLSMFGIITEINQFFFTDLTMDELLSIGLDMMKNPVQEVHKLEIPTTYEQEVMKKAQNELSVF
jgi:hypothetical protein